MFPTLRLVEWYEAIDVARELPKLSTYLGRVELGLKYWCIEAVPRLLSPATTRLAVPVSWEVVDDARDVAFAATAVFRRTTDHAPGREWVHRGGLRDTFRLLRRFAQTRLGRAPSRVRLDDLDVGLIEAFLVHLNKTPTITRGRAISACRPCTALSVRRAERARAQPALPTHSRYSREAM
jgi:hypothetical protein